MKKSILLSCVVLLLSVGAVAQLTSGYILSARIPFSFTVRGNVMPAGDYTIEVPSLAFGSMLIRQAGGTISEYVLRVPKSERWTGNAQFTFQRVGSEYFLVEVSDTRFGVQRIEQDKTYKQAMKLASAQTVIVTAKK
jgi:hypothetical protein